MPPRKSRRKLWFILFGLVLILGGAWWYLTHRTNSFPSNSATVTRRTIRETLELSGEVTASEQANLHFPAGGLVTYYPYREGDEIQKFSTIAALDQRALKGTLTKYLNTYAKERNDFDATQDTYTEDKELGNLDAEVRRILEGAQYDLNNSVIDVELQDLSLKLSRLTSPLTGILVSSPITTSNVYVSALDEWVVVDPTSLIFTADLDESDLAKVSVGLTAKIELDAFPEFSIDSTLAKISYLSKLTSTGTIFELTFPLPPAELSRLRLGLNGNVSLLLSTREEVLSIPIEAVKDELDGYSVTVVKDGKPVTKQIKLGVSDDQYYEVIEGLSDGETIYYGN